MKVLKPAIFVPTLYFIEGLPYALVVYASVIFYKNLGQSLPFIGNVTSMFYLAWALKFAWAPMVDLVGTKKIWIVVAQAILSLVCFLFVPAVQSSQAAYLTLFGFAFMAFVSATQDVAIDGYYLEVIEKEKQSLYVGVRSAMYKMAILFGQSVLIMLVGWLVKHQAMTMGSSWSVAFASCGVIFALASVVHFFGLPASSRELSETSSENHMSVATFFTVFRSFFAQEKILAIVLYILIFRLGDAFVLKMASPFLLDTFAHGGMAYDDEMLGLINMIGVGFLLVGGIIGGVVVSKFGLKRTLMPTAIIQNAAILLYFFLAQYRPPFLVVQCFNAFEQFGYGLGTAAYTVFLMTTVKSSHKAGHYAIATAFMALGIMIPGFFSGNLAQALGYKTFFLLAFFPAIPGMITILLLPMDDK